MHLRAFLLVLALFASSQAFAVTYYWEGGFGTTNQPTAELACSDASKRWAQANAYTYVSSKITRLNDTTFYCYVDYSDYRGIVFTNRELDRYITRKGDSCESGTYDGQLGKCVVPAGQAGEECDGPDFMGMPSLYNSQGVCVTWDKADKPALCKSLAKSGTTFTDLYVAFDGDGNPEKPQAEKFGCEINVVDVAQCKMPVPKCGSGICIEHMVTKCRVGVTFTGNVSGDGNGSGYPVSGGAGEEGVCPEGVDCTPKPEPVVEESKPCNYMYNGQVVQCESSEFKGDPGEMNCGRVNNGPYTCTKKVPQSNGIDIKTKITTEPTADGGTKVTKEDEHTKTVCSAPGSCTTQVTNNKTVIVKDSSGKTVSESGECTGALCDGKGNGKTPSKGGNCQPGDECGTEEEGGSFSGPENGEVPGFGESLQSFKDKVSGAPIIAGISAIQMPAGGSCSMSSASTMIGTISGDTVCQNSGWLDPLYYVFLSMGALNAVRILMSA
ncbi:hypothetical protein PSEUDT2PL_00025 [Stutzerimonas stutzeri]|nr:hypothetical protein PSEUDT2PL_00025 [Stutzerimonas stutzeri]